MEIQDCLNEFQIVIQNQSNDYQSLAICANTSQGNAVLRKTLFANINGVLVSFIKEELRLNCLLLYQPKEIHPLLFCNNLEQIISNHEIQVVFGDFNINFFDENESRQLKEMVYRENFLQIVREATFLSSGILLDHVYVKPNLPNEFKNIRCEVKSVYYSDHDCVQICISKG